MTLGQPRTRLSHAVCADRADVWHHLTQHKPFETSDPGLLMKGRGMRVRDADGAAFLDAVSDGVWTGNLGYGRLSIAEAVKEALAEMDSFAQTIGSGPGARSAEKLIEKMLEMFRAYYGSSGIALVACGLADRVRDCGPITPGFVEVLAYLGQYPDAQDYGLAAADAIKAVILREGPDIMEARCLEPITAGGNAAGAAEAVRAGAAALLRQAAVAGRVGGVASDLGRL